MDAHRRGAAALFALLVLVVAPGAGGAAGRARAMTMVPPTRRPPPSNDILGGAQEGTVLFDGDGGKVEIVPRTPLVPRAPIDHGGPIVERPFLRLVLVGNAWTSASAQAPREKMTEYLQRRHPMADQIVEDFDDPDGALRDLEVQRRLDARLRSEGEPQDPGTVFVVAAAPGLEVRLSESASSSDFAAYHNWFHRAGGVVRYVVVPYDDDNERWIAAVSRSVEQTLRNPEGNGWY